MACAGIRKHNSLRLWRGQHSKQPCCCRRRRQTASAVALGRGVRNIMFYPAKLKNTFSTNVKPSEVDVVLSVHSALKSVAAEFKQ